MAPRRIELLDSIGFDWGARRGQAAWDLRYNELRLYFERNGHSDFRTRDPDNPALGRWVTEQRSLHRQLQDKTLQGEELELFRQRIPLLERIQFRWSMQGPEGEDDEGSNAAGEDD
jgi:hypothetical protein